MLKIYLEGFFLKNLQKSWNFLSPEKWEPWIPHPIPFHLYEQQVIDKSMDTDWQ